MIVRPRPDWLRLLFVWRGSVPAPEFERLLSIEDRDRLRPVRYKPALVQPMEGPLGRLTDALGGCERIAEPGGFIQT